MSRVPTVPWPQLASAYIEAVAAGRPPAAYARSRFGLSVRQWEDRRARMTHNGWLPASTPPRGGPTRLADCRLWALEARRQLDAKLAGLAEADAIRDERIRTHREEKEALRREQHFNAERWAEMAAAKRRRRAELAAEKQPAPQGRPGAPVLEAFL